MRYQVPQGGIYFWLRLDERIDTGVLTKKMFEQGVACRPGERFSDDPSRAGYLRIAFLQVPEDEVERGIAALGQALRESLR